MSSSSGPIPGARTGSSPELEPEARTQIWSIPSLLPPTSNPQVPPPLEHPHTHLFPPALGLAGIARSPSRAGLSPLSRISAVHPRPRPTRLTVDAVLMTSSPPRVPSAQVRLPASQPWHPRLCATPDSCPELLPTCPALPSNSPPVRRLFHLLGGGCLCRGHPPCCVPCPPGTLFSTPQA